MGLNYPYVITAATQGPPGPRGPQGPAGGGSGGSSLPPELIVSASTLTFDFDSSKSATKVITLTSSVTSSTAINAVDGLEATFTVKTDVGGFGFVFPSNFYQATAISTANANNSAGVVLQQKWRYDLADSKWYAVTPLMY